MHMRMLLYTRAATTFLQRQLTDRQAHALQRQRDLLQAFFYSRNSRLGIVCDRWTWCKSRVLPFALAFDALLADVARTLQNAVHILYHIHCNILTSYLAEQEHLAVFMVVLWCLSVFFVLCTPLQSSRPSLHHSNIFLLLKVTMMYCNILMGPKLNSVGIKKNPDHILTQMCPKNIISILSSACWT